MYEVIGLLGAFFFGGIALAIIDRSLGVKTRRAYYRWTSKDPLPASDQRGFLVGQPASAKLRWASIISLIQTLGIVTAAGFNVNFMRELSLWFFEAAFMVAGFYMSMPFRGLGRFFMKNVATRIDKIESGESTVGEIAGEVASKATAQAAGAALGAATAVVSAAGSVFDEPETEGDDSKTESETNQPVETTKVEEVEPEPVVEEPKPDPRAVIERFKGGR